MNKKGGGGKMYIWGRGVYLNARLDDTDVIMMVIGKNMMVILVKKNPLIIGITAMKIKNNFSIYILKTMLTLIYIPC